jgi:hypothetical protein
MVILRIMAGVFFLFAALAFAADITRAANGSGFSMTSFAAHWTAFAPQMIASARKAISSVHPFLWDSMIWRLLLLPAWFCSGPSVSFSGILAAARAGSISSSTENAQRQGAAR